MRTLPHVERLARLLHNRVVRRVLHDHPAASVVLLVGDLVAHDRIGPVPELVQLVPVTVCDADGVVLGAATGAAWTVLCDDLRPEFALLARVSPVELFVPYVLDLRQLDLRVEADLEVDPTFGTARPDAD